MAKNKPPKEHNTAHFFQGLFTVFATTIDKIGLPGFIATFFAWFMVAYSTQEQKSVFIDQFILGKDIPQHGLIIGIIVLGVAMLFGQHAIWKKRVEMLNSKVKSLEEWKEGHQNAQLRN
ncbi:MAG: hypothetical protein ACOYNS_10395 [Bacteroidota bacterium]